MTIPRMRSALETSNPTADHVWYVAYGSNMNADRLNYYLAGGRPPAGALTYPGCRDTSPPSRSRAVMIPGQLYFALEAQAWTGGMAFLDPQEPGETAARAYLLTRGQLSDIVAQEMGNEPGPDLDFSGALAYGRMSLGPGHYETLVYVGEMDESPMLTFTAPWSCRDVAGNRPAEVYLRIIMSGLMEAHGWDAMTAGEYLASRPGAEGHWTAAEIALLHTRNATPLSWQQAGT